MSTRFLRNPLNTTPQTCAFTEFETLENAQAWLLASESAELKADMRAHGCSNMTMAICPRSPLAPDLLRANSSD
ncbi:MAG: hypothetical protein KDE31_22270 [Caldilineaceae bacterium]|nr:hypothetical protein [Caldilineaceae bacterium]